MIVKCINSKATGLEKNEAYVVLCIGIQNDNIYFAIDEDKNLTYSTEIPSYYMRTSFEIIDFRISRYWSKKYQNLSYKSLVSLPNNSEISFDEWKDNFYYILHTGEDEVENISKKEADDVLNTYKKYKALMHLEFATPDIKKKAIYLDHKNWLMCPNCDETWEDELAPIHEMVKCPKCNSLFLSPK